MKRSTIVLLTIAIPGIMMAQVPAVSSSAQPSSRRPVTFVVVDSLPSPNLLVMITRQAGSGGHDYVTIRRSAINARVIIASIKTIDRSAVRHGESPEKRVAMFITAGVHLPPPPEADNTRGEEIASRLRQALPVAVPGLGFRPSITVDR